MATILPFVPRAVARITRPQREAAAIIIFPGVRYERTSNATPQERVANGNRPKPDPARR